MPQMAPIYWLYLLFFFLTTFMMFFMMNYFIKPYESMDSFDSTSPKHFKSWKL
uniref:ATP synthase F0 subunit 8 n=1 Tax=Plagusia squamosa TaxID=157785 RepID=UPI0020297087|nr:ATP synthase F0 subunit 8 [Plagusia squamosa]UPL65002.1 ATP synthase F0 subunit 8 [Plagusia squamosa]